MPSLAWKVTLSTEVNHLLHPELMKLLTICGLLLTRMENELRGTSVHRNILSVVSEHIGSTKEP